MIKVLLLCSLLLSGCSLFQKKPDIVIPEGTKIEISDDLLKECKELEPLSINKDSSDPFVDVLDAHRKNSEAYKECASMKRDLNKVARKLANKEIK